MLSADDAHRAHPAIAQELPELVVVGEAEWAQEGVRVFPRDNRTRNKEIKAGTYQPPMSVVARTTGGYVESWLKERTNAYAPDEGRMASGSVMIPWRKAGLVFVQVSVPFGRPSGLSAGFFGTTVVASVVAAVLRHGG